MEWAEGFGRHAKITNDMAMQRYAKIMTNGDVKQLQLLMSNWTEGMADKTITYEVENFLDAWRKFYNQQLPEMGHIK